MNKEAHEKMKKREADAAKKWQDEQNDKWISKYSVPPLQENPSAPPSVNDLHSFFQDE